MPLVVLDMTYVTGRHLAPTPALIVIDVLRTSRLAVERIFPLVKQNVWHLGNGVLLQQRSHPDTDSVENVVDIAFSDKSPLETADIMTWARDSPCSRLLSLSAALRVWTGLVRVES